MEPLDQDRALVNKVDALIKKHNPQTTIDDRNIPVLTEVIAAPDWVPPESQPATDGLLQFSEAEIDQIANDIFTRVFERIDLELADKLEDRLVTQLAAQVSAVVARVLSDLHQDIANEIGDAVNAAIADRLRNRPAPQ